MYKISNRQLAILKFIRNEVHSKGYPPSVREIGEAVGLASSSTVHGHLDRLEKKGVIRRDKTKPRAIELLNEDQPNAFFVPIIRQIMIASCLFDIENIEDYFPLPSYYARDKVLFMVRALSSSIHTKKITKEDCLIVQQQHTAAIGDLVVAVNTASKQSGWFTLEMTNEHLPTSVFGHMTIIGKVIAVFRTYP